VDHESENLNRAPCNVVTVNSGAPERAILTNVTLSAVPSQSVLQASYTDVQRFVTSCGLVEPNFR